MTDHWTSSGIRSARDHGIAQLWFVVHRHEARQLHFDLRLELGGVLKSWAIPKGPSLSPAEKRLALRMEDHPLTFADFEGTIEHGYGAGEVRIWDRGTYERAFHHPEIDREEELLQDLRRGKLEIILHGRKLKGEFTLVRMERATQENAWLLIKHRDRYAVNADDVGSIVRKGVPKTRRPQRS